MKVAIICYTHFDATISLAKYLSIFDKDLEIDFICILSHSYKSSTIINLNGKAIKNGFCNEKELPNIIDKEVLHYLNNKIGFKLFIFNSDKLYDIANYKLLLELKRKLICEKYDLLHFVGNHHWIVLLNYLFKKKAKIHTIHEPFPHRGISKYRLFRHRLKMTLLINSNCHITVPSNISYLRFNSHFELKSDNISIIPFGAFEIYREYLNKVVDKSNDTLLYFGIIDKYKGIDVLIDTMRKLSKSHPNLKLIIAGRGNLNYDISTSDTNIKLINRHISNEELAELNQLTTVVVCPYTSASQSGVVMTSFAFGNPIVATNVGALPEAIENGITGIIIEPNNSDILCKTIIELFSNPNKLEELRSNVSKFINSEQKWLDLASQTYILYQKQISCKQKN